MFHSPVLNRLFSARETPASHLCVWDADLFEQVEGDSCAVCLFEMPDDDRDDPGAF